MPSSDFYAFDPFVGIEDAAEASLDWSDFPEGEIDFADEITAESSVYDADPLGGSPSRWS